MRRREFISLLGGAAAWPLAAHAQQQGKMPTIRFLGAATASVATQWLATFVQRLRNLGWVEGRNVAIDARWAEGRESFAQIAAEFVEDVDLIVTWSTESALMAKRATSVIPIVFAISTDPVGSGLVASLARPGGNATGLSVQTIDLAGKRLELLREVVPKLSRLAILANVNATDTAMEMREIDTIVRQLGVDVTTLRIRRTEDIAPAFKALKVQLDALFVVGDPLTFTNRGQIITLAQDRELPTMYSIREFVEAGVLCPMGQTSPISFGVRPSSPTKFCVDEAFRHSGRAANQVRSRHQSQDCQGAGAQRSR